MSLTEDTIQNGVVVHELAPRNVPWTRIFATIGILAALGAVIALYYLRTYSGLTERDQIDIAQVARSVASGNGFSTRFIRPFNAGLMSEAIAPLPEVNHGPLYPLAIAVVFKLKGPSDQAVIWVSMAFMFLTLVGTYFLGQVLFDWRTGAFAAAMLGVSASTLRVGVGASEWPMAAFWLVLLMLTVAAHHKSTLRGTSRAGIVHPIIAGILVAMLFMTHHLLLFLSIPVAIYFGVTGDRRRQHLAVFAVVAVIAVGPWACRNAVKTGGSILGANAWDIMVDSKAFPGDTFYRSMDVASLGIARVVFFPIERFSSFSQKLMDGTSQVIRDCIPMLGLIISCFAVVSMLYRFKTPTANAARGLIYGLAPVLCMCIALFSLNRDALIMVAPAAAVFGCAYFFLLLDAKKLHPVFWRGVVIAVTILTSWSALTAIVRGPHEEANPMNEVTRLMAQGDNVGVTCMYTDVPWLAAWRSLKLIAVWLPRSDEDISQLSLDGLPMTVFVLTSESRKLPPDDTWYKLYTMKLQRDFVENPAKALQRIRAYGKTLGRSAEQAEMMKSFFRQSQRSAAVYDSIMGFKQADLGPLASDEIQVYERRDD
ncbi:MAG: ArnT family glycosyltransferase [Armatimonadota bacterium]